MPGAAMRHTYMRTTTCQSVENIFHSEFIEMIFLNKIRKVRCFYTNNRGFCEKKNETYIQGQNPSPGIREYFYCVDHNGMLFLDDSKMKHWTAALKEKKLLFNFFKRLRFNETGRYTEFKYISLCGKERNFVRCSDRPFVFNAAEKDEQHNWVLHYNHAGSLLTQKFEPHKILMVPETGRVYHPGPGLCGGVGLVSDKLSILWTQEQRFVFGTGEMEPPTSFVWEDAEISLDNSLLEVIERDRQRGIGVL